jgi:hypothetical protein
VLNEIFQIFPIEIRDKIFLLLDKKILKKTRCIQSVYVKKITEYFTIRDAERSGNVECIKWLIDRSKWNYNMDYTFNRIIEYGNIDDIKWALGRGFKWNNFSLHTAVGRKDLRIVKWARENGCHWGFDVIRKAIDVGDLEIMEWLRQNECPWGCGVGYEIDGYIFNHAIINSTLENIKWLWSSGCPIGGGIYVRAFCHERMDVVEWLKEIDIPFDDSIMYEMLSSMNSIEYIEWLRNNGVEWTENSFETAMYSCSLKILKYLYENGCPFDRYSILNIALECNMKTNCLKYLKSIGCVLNFADYLNCSGYTDSKVCEWVEKNYGNLFTGLHS